MVRLATGRPKTLVYAQGKPWRTAFARDEVQLPIAVDTGGLLGDTSANTRYHHDADCSVCVYPVAHFASLGGALDLRMGPDSAGENLTIAGADETTVCIGDRFGAGELGTGVEFEVSEPRVPCGTWARFHDRPNLVRVVAGTGMTGWFFRVIRGGMLESRSLELRARTHPAWTVARVNRMRYQRTEGSEALAEICGMMALSERWRAWFAQQRG